MNVTPQYVNKIVRDKENFTLETLVKLQQILDIPILASYYEQKTKTTPAKEEEATELPSA